MKKAKYKNEVQVMKNIILLLSLLVFFGIEGNTQTIDHDSLTINNISAGFNADGSLFWDFSGSRFRAPKGGQANSIFAGALWLAGIDGGGALHTAAQTYRQSGSDFWPGPLDTIGNITLAASNAWNYIWNVTRAEINQHIYDFADNGVINGPIANAILTWPAIGNIYALGDSGISLAITQDMAPFIDVNRDGIYNAYQGDYPDVKGDQALWWVHNDNLSAHTESGGASFGIQIKTLAYAFSCSDDSTLNNTLFVQYDLTNKSQNNYTDLTAGMWLDFDYGCFNNDYIGCNPSLDYFYGYNGVDIDTTCATIGFELEVGTMATVILKGINNPAGAQTGLTSFMFYNNDFTVTGNPQSPNNYNGLMNGFWNDNTPITSDSCRGYGGSVPTKFAYPDAPGGPLFPASWSECSCENAPADRRGLGSSGAGNLAAGETITLTYAYGNYNISTQSGCAAVRPDSQVQHLKDLFANDFQSACTSCIGNTCVWPGDANSDGVANNFDVLELGIAASSTGPARPNANILWQGQSGPVWSNLFASGVNYQHTDCDGNGLVDFDDLVPLNINYGFTHLKTDATATASSTDPNLFVNASEDTVSLNTPVSVPIHLGNTGIPADNIYGLAFTFQLDPLLVKPGSVYVEFDSCWLGQANVNLMTIGKYFADGHLEIGISRTGGQSLSAIGNIATVHFITTDNLSGKNTISAILPMSINNVKVIDEQEQTISVNLGFDTLIIADRFESIATISTILEANIYPNPTYNDFNVVLPSVKQGSTVQIAIYNTLGEEISTQTLDYNSSNPISIANYSAGVYYVTIKVGEKSTSKRLLVF